MMKNRDWSITFKVVRGLIVIFGIIFALVGVFGAATGVGYFARLVEQTEDTKINGNACKN